MNQVCRTPKAFDAFDWLALLTTHIPYKNEQMVRYYGYYSNKSRGLREEKSINRGRRRCTKVFTASR